MMRPSLVALTLLLATVAVEADAAAVVVGFDSGSVPRNDDGSVGPVPLGFEVALFGTRTNQVYVNNNGNITFDGALSEYTPFNLLSTSRRIVAPFFADVDTRSAGDQVTYGTGTFEGKPAFGANWINVDYYSSSTAHTRRNSFQLLVVSRADRRSGDFDLVFNYDRIEWEAGTASGANADGLGGSSARAGYAIGGGLPGSAFELSGSAVNGAFLDSGNSPLIRGSRGSQVPGRYVFEIRSAPEAQISTLTPFANAPAFAAASDSSGNVVVFQSRATNLGGTDPNPGSDVFRIDTRSGALTRASVDDAEQPIAGDAIEASVSQDGAWVLFVAPDAGVGKLAGEAADARVERLKGTSLGVFLRNTISGTTQRAGPANGGGSGSQPRASGSGSHLVFTGTASAAQGQSGQDNVFRTAVTRNGDATALGAAQCVSCKAVNADGSDAASNSNGSASRAAISSDGRFVVWQTTATNSLTATSTPCPTATSTVMLRNLVTGVAARVSAPAGGSCGSGGSRAPQIDHGGTRVVFESDQPLLAGDGNGVTDVYAYDVAAGTLSLLSSKSGAIGNAASTSPTISGDGKVVAFTSAATNLGDGSDGNGNVVDLHALLLANAQLQRLATTDTGLVSNGAVARPALNFDGSRVVFDSVAGNLAPGAVQGRELVFQRANPLVSGVLKSATWWKADESGWGLFIFDQGNLLTPAWFTYDTDGEPAWFIAAGAFPQADGSYAGDLFRFTGVPLAQIVGVASDPPTQVGRMVLRFTGESALSFQYTVNGTTQTKAMTRFPFGTRGLRCRATAGTSRATATNYSDVWYGGESTPGWGLFLNHVDDQVFAVWYTYDTDREPLFLLILTERQADGSYSGGVFRSRNGTPFGQINGAPPSTEADQLGTATFRFTNGETGTFSYVLGAVAQSKPIQRLLVGDTASVCESVPETR